MYGPQPGHPFTCRRTQATSKSTVICVLSVLLPGTQEQSHTQNLEKAITSFPTSRALASPPLIGLERQHCCLQSHPFGQLVRPAGVSDTPCQEEKVGILPLQTPPCVWCSCAQHNHTSDLVGRAGEIKELRQL